ncbi:MAG: VWA domain-containing protein [Planctomycetes bacterium]|nr:VWA domain-containing protein [Planctomycetota bacterium]
MKPAPALPMLESAERTRGVGILEVLKDQKKVLLPLAGVAMSARVADRVAHVTVTETFRNTYAEALEAVYIFPMAGGCAVSSFEMKVGKRVIKGVVKERGEARRTYAKAVEDGKRAALLEQERDDVFTVTVGNLPPGEEVSVKIEYSERLPYFDDGTTELRLPVVVAPRYIPGAPQDGEPSGDGVEPDTDAVPDASRITPPRLAPGFDPRVSLGIEVELLHGDGDPDLADLACSQHATKTAVGRDAVRVTLALDDEPLDRDFVLRWKLAAKDVRKTCLAFRDGKDLFAMLSLVPPRRDGFLGLARDVVFVLDRSGSMGGVKMSSAARACSLLLHTLGPRDRFAVQAFDDSQEWMVAGDPAKQWTAADEAGIEKGDRFLRTIDARGGTELDAAVGGALGVVGARAPVKGRTPIVVVLTDGEVGDESRILQRIQKELGDARVFTVGIDTAVNDGFLKRLASLGGGTASFVVPGEKLEDALRAVGREIGAPVVTDLRISGEVEKASLTPDRMPDLFAGRAATAFFRLAGTKVLRVTGKYADGKPYHETVTVREIPMPAIAQLWARSRVADLEDRFRLEPALQTDIKTEIVNLAVRHTLLTRFTAFVVVDESEVVNKDGKSRHVIQPVAMPAKWEQPESKPMTGVFASIPCGVVAQPCCEMQVFDDAEVPPPGDAAAAMSLVPGSGGRGQAGKTPAPPPPPSPLQVSVPKPSPVSKRAEKDADDVVTPRERESVAQAFEAFAKAIAAAKADVDAGHVPEAGPIEKAREALMKALAGSDLGTRLGGLQKILRSSVPEILAALGVAGISAAALRPLFERLRLDLEQAGREAEPFLAGKRKSSWRFWEKSV